MHATAESWHRKRSGVPRASAADDWLDLEDPLAEAPQPARPEQKPWIVLVVDDDHEVHRISRLVLRDVVFDGRPLEIHCAGCTRTARTLLGRYPDAAVLLLDVVMDTEHAGLDLVAYIRKQLGNDGLRIILRTGHPGQAPEHAIVVDYDINDYRDKTELTSQKLVTSVVTALRAYRDIMARREEERKLKALFDSAMDAVILADDQGTITAWNAGAEAIFGWRAAEAIGRSIVDTTLPPRLREQGERLLRQGCQAVATTRMEGIGLRRDGSEFPIERSLSGFSVERKCYFATFIRDISQRKAAEVRLDLAASVFAHAREGIAIVDPGGIVVEVNDAFVAITGHARAGTVGRHYRTLLANCASPANIRLIRRKLASDGHWSGELDSRRASGEVFVEALDISAIFDEDGEIRHYVVMLNDVTALREHQRKLERLAHYDALTGLPNRILLADRLQQALLMARRRQSMCVVAYLDLDGFKEVNDRFRHAAGDELLIAVAARMKEVLREGDTLARFGGDEFVAVLSDIASAAECDTVLGRILHALAAPFPICGSNVGISASIGATLFPADDSDADALIRHADQAMYQAKQAGKNRCHLFDPQRDREAVGRRERIARLARALADEEFVLHFQPKVNMRSGEVVGVEALIRWLHPERGLLPPRDFLPELAGSDLMLDVNDWVLQNALRQAAAWADAGLRLPVSVNVDARFLLRDGFVNRLAAQLLRWPQMQSGMLQLEMLETEALGDIDAVSAIIRVCRSLGVSFALDDFGTGYSSLTYLKALPAGVLKIDQSFVRDMLWDAGDTAIVEGILGLAGAFRRQAVAEGVETSEHGVILLRLGCDIAQGYGIGRPMPAAEIAPWVADWKPDPAWLKLAGSAPDERELPLIYAEIDHRACVRAIEAFIRNASGAALPDAGNCHFGDWLDALMAGAGSGAAQIDALARAHERLHLLAREVAEMRAAGAGGENAALLGELVRLQDDASRRFAALRDDKQAFAAKDEEEHCRCTPTQT